LLIKSLIKKAIETEIDIKGANIKTKKQTNNNNKKSEKEVEKKSNKSKF